MCVCVCVCMCVYFLIFFTSVFQYLDFIHKNDWIMSWQKMYFSIKCDFYLLACYSFDYILQTEEVP